MLHTLFSYGFKGVFSSELGSELVLDLSDRETSEYDGSLSDPSEYLSDGLSHPPLPPTE